MRDNFGAVMDEVFRHEGGMSTDRQDPGNWTGGKVGSGAFLGTKYGIAAHANPGVDIPNLTKAQALEIYRAKYWSVIRGDDLPAGVDLATMDPAVNSGPSRGARWLQAAVGAAQDGKVGPATIAAAERASSVATIKRICSARLKWLQGLGTWGRYGRGWSRRVAEVEAKGVQMAGGNLLAENGKAQARKASDQATAVVAAGGSGASTTLAWDQLPIWAPWVIGVVALLIVVHLIGKARHNGARAKAYADLLEEAK